MRQCCVSCSRFSSAASGPSITCAAPVVVKAPANGARTGRHLPQVLNTQTLPAIQSALEELDLDGWLLFDFRGLNPIATGMLAMDGLLTRRIFAYVPREGAP